MNNSLPQINDLRNNIDFASTTQFFHTFQSAFRPWPASVQDVLYARQLHTSAHLNNQKEEYVFETEDLERMILDVAERVRFEDLLIRMLRVATRNRFINVQNWQSYFSREFDKREFDQINPFIPPPSEDDAPEQQQQQQQEEGKKDEVGDDIKEEPSEEIHTESQQQAISTSKKPDLINYFNLPLDTRVHLLYLLCEWQLDDPERFREHLESEEDAVQWRVDPVGFDKKGSTFWLFDDNRLYKETPKPKKKPAAKKTTTSRKRKRFTPVRRSSRRAAVAATEEAAEEESEDESEWMPWKLICSTKADWEQLPAKYEHSKHVDEQRFYQLLVNDLLPKVLPVIEEHEKELKKQEAILNRKRSSRILIKELEALERAASAELEDKAMLATANADGHRRSGRTSTRLEQRSKEKEQKEKEMLAQAREQRLLERERRIQEREYRALQREKRQQQQEEEEDGNDQQNEETVDGGTTINEQQPQSQSQPSTTTEDSTTTEATTPKKRGRKPKTPAVADGKEQKPKRKYVRKLDENGNPIPRKPRMDKDGNPIPPKKRGRKPKNRNSDDENWMFACICGVSGQNLDDGEPMVACEKCGVWQHIKCLQNSGHVDKFKSLDNISFICSSCEKKEQEVEVDIEDEQSTYNYKRQKTEYYGAPDTTGYYRSQISQQQQQTATSAFMQTTWYPQPQQHSASSVRNHPSTAENQHSPSSQHQSSYYPSLNSLPSIRSTQQQSAAYPHTENGGSSVPTNTYHNNSAAVSPQRSYAYQSNQQQQQQQNSTAPQRQFIPYQIPPSSSHQQPPQAHYIHASHIAQQQKTISPTNHSAVNNTTYHNILPHPPQRPIATHSSISISPAASAADPRAATISPSSKPQQPSPSVPREQLKVAYAAPQQNSAAPAAPVVPAASFTNGTIHSYSPSNSPALDNNGGSGGNGSHINNISSSEPQ